MDELNADQPHMWDFFHPVSRDFRDIDALRIAYASFLLTQRENAEHIASEKQKIAERRR